MAGKVDLLKRLHKIFVVLKGNTLKLKKEKVCILKDEICYLGYRINKCGLNPIPEILDAILNTPTPTNVSELKAFLGMLTYYHKILNELSTILEFLHKLL